MKTDIKTSQIYADSARGIYIPQHFAESANRDMFKYIDADQWQILESGPETEYYWDVWQEVLDNAETICGGVLWQDGDLWIIWPDQARDAVNEYCETMEEYETTHIDAGDAYSHMVAESWSQSNTDYLVKALKDCDDIDSRWKGIAPDTLADYALESFDMESGHIFSSHSGIVLESFPVCEIEIDLDSLGIDGLTLDYIRESCDCYIRDGSTLAYISTDAVWMAVLNVETFNSYITQHFED
jgi:hypothetical protein